MKTVLVVDDSSIDRRVATRVLEKGGWQVVQASGGKEALKQVRQTPPNVVVTDLTMPEMGGLELIVALQQTMPALPVVAMTARGSEEAATRALESGAASYVPKRALQQRLLRTVERVDMLRTNGVGHLITNALRHVDQNELRFVLENDVEQIHATVAYLQHACMNITSLPRESCVRVRVALEEALLNALLHGNLEIRDASTSDHDELLRLVAERRSDARYTSRRLWVEARVGRSEAFFRVRDDGAGFDVGRLPNREDHGHFDEVSGRGLALMRAFFDVVAYSSTGTELTLIKFAEPLKPFWRTSTESEQRQPELAELRVV